MANLGIIPSGSKTFDVIGYIGDGDYIEGGIYVNKPDGRLYIYDTVNDRSSPGNGLFPIYNGKNFIITKFSNEKYIDNLLKIDLETLTSSIDDKIAQEVLYKHRRSSNDRILEPQITDTDNMFTQCIKGVLNKKRLTIVDLVDMSSPKLDDETISNYYSALTKITFMRLDKWYIWIDRIFHLGYDLTVYKDGNSILVYKYPSNEFDTGVVKYDEIIGNGEDPFKQIVTILMLMNNITKDTLRSPTISDYTINNMLTTLTQSKLSAQIFSRFIRMAKLSYGIKIYENDEMLFEYME